MSQPTPPARAGEIRARGWGWRFNERCKPSISGLDLVIEPGERVLLLGASGSGKSTLLAALAGVLGDDQGEATGELTIDGKAPRDQRGRVGLVLQDPENQIILESVGDDVAFGCENLGVDPDEIWPRVRESLKLVGLNFAPGHHTSRLSGGQQQRLAMAGVLAMRPGVILLDEPTANLDPVGVREVRHAVEQVADETGATVVLVEHRVELWWDFATRVIVVGTEGIIFDGAPTGIPAQVLISLSAAGVWLPTDARVRLVSSSAFGAEHLLEATNLVSAYSGKSPASVPVSLPVEAGRVVALTGPNGIGKTATALTMAGLLPPRAGSLAASESLRAGAKKELVKWRSKDLLTRIGMVFQSPEHQFITSTVRHELSIGLQAVGHSEKDVNARVDELLVRLGLAEFAEVHPFTLSGGQKRRLSVGTALATKPQVLVLDEPTFGQDARTWESLIELFAEMRSEGHAMLAVTHDELFVRMMADVEYAMVLS